MEMDIKKNKGLALSSSKGFTLIELMVAAAIFTGFILSVTTITMVAIQAQRKFFAVQNVQQAGDYLLETVSKEIRTGTINTSGSGSRPILNITNSEGETLNYQFNSVDNRLYRAGFPISPADVDLTGSFYLRDYGDVRKVVTIIMQVGAKDNQLKTQAHIYLQSTIAPRP